jgi:hypothetical protein
MFAEALAADGREKVLANPTSGATGNVFHHVPSVLPISIADAIAIAVVKQVHILPN